MHTWICSFCKLQVFLHWRHNSTHHHHCQSIQNCYGNEAWKYAPRNFFYNISTKCTRDSSFSTTKKGKKNKKTAEYSVNTPQFSPFQNHKIGSERDSSGVAAPLLEWQLHISVYTGQCTPAQSLISYFSRCSQAGAWDPALYIPARHRVCCMMEGGGCSGPAWLILSLGRGVNSRLYCCPGLPGFPRENIQRGIDVAEKRHAVLFIEQVKRRGEERKRGGVREKRGVANKRRGTEESESRQQSVISAVDSVHGDLG